MNIKEIKYCAISGQHCKVPGHVASFDTVEKLKADYSIT